MSAEKFNVEVRRLALETATRAMEDNILFWLFVNGSCSSQKKTQNAKNNGQGREG